MRVSCRNRNHRSFSHLCVVLSMALAGSGCLQEREQRVTVSGKTIHRGMALERVHIQVFLARGDDWVEHTTVRSGYHGSFVVRLAPGRYLLRARTVLRKARAGNVELLGTLRDLAVSPQAVRIDRIVIEMEAVAPQ